MHDTTLSPRFILPSGWFKSEDSKNEEIMKELETEMAKGHALKGISLKVTAYKKGTDDVLFEHQGNDMYSLVRLTWSGETEEDAYHPIIEFQGTYKEFLEYEASFE